jgi:uncharacterized protein YkwD
MRAAFAIAALAGSAIAAPGYGYAHPEKEVKNIHVVVETVVQTVYVTEGYEPAAPTPTPEAVYEAPAAPTTVVYEAPVVPSSIVYEVPAAPSSKYEAPAPYVPAPTPTPEAPKPTPAPEAPSNSGYMAVVDEWRSKLGLKALTYDAKLESNAMDDVVSSNGQMVHKLNPGTFAQVLAPAKPEEFKKAFVGGWLCEMPQLPGLAGVCDTMSEGWSYMGQTGHAEILTSPNYSKIGCANHAGIWCCDLA